MADTIILPEETTPLSTSPSKDGRSRELSASEWQERIRNGLRFQQRFARSNEWVKYKQYYRHTWPSGTLPVNIYFSILRAMVPRIYFRNPRVTVTPRKPGLEAELNARIVQAIDNWLLGELMTKNEIKDMIQDAFFTGNGTGFIGYDSEFGYDPTQLNDQGQFTLSQFNRRGQRIEYNANVGPGMPWFLRARPEDVIWPWGCERPQSAEWVALRVFRPLSDLRKDPKYTVPKELRGNFTPTRTQPEGGALRDPQETFANGLVARDREWVELYQIHDARTGKIYAITLTTDKFLRNQFDELQLDGLPVESFTFNPDPDYIYGVPDARIIQPQQLELNEIRNQAMRHRRIDMLKFLYKDGTLSDTELQKLTNEKVMAGLKIDSDAASLKDAIITFQPNASGILQDMTLAGEVVQGDIREVVGFSRNASGEFQGKTHISATETQRVAQALNVRLDERKDIVADMLTRVVRKFNQIVFTNWSRERVQQIVGPDGAQWWLKFTGPQIKDEYDLSIAPEEGANIDSDTKFQRGLEAAEVWAKMNQGQIAQGIPVPAEIQRLVFSPFSSVGLDIDRLLAQSQAGAQQTQAQLQAGQGQSPQNAVSAGTLAQALGGGQ